MKATHLLGLAERIRPYQSRSFERISPKGQNRPPPPGARRPPCRKEPP